MHHHRRSVGSCHTTHQAALGIALLAAALLAGACTGDLDEFESAFDTEFTVPAPTGGVFEPYTRTKTFTLDGDPADAESVYFKHAGISVQAPTDTDLTFLSRIEIYIEADSELTLLAEAEGFRPGEASRRLELVYNGDVRGFVEDQKVRLTWIVYPTLWGYTWPDEGVTIRTDVTLLVNPDIL